MRLKSGHVGSKTRSPGQIVENPCIRSRGQIFSLIIMKHGQNACLDLGHIQKWVMSGQNVGH